MWVEPNTHTHAHWVFTERNAHLVGVRAKVEGQDGTVYEDEQVVRIAVGVDPEVAADAQCGKFRAEGDGGEVASQGTGALAVVALLAVLVVRGRR